jgi:hypothetical protein
VAHKSEQLLYNRWIASIDLLVDLSQHADKGGAAFSGGHGPLGGRFPPTFSHAFAITPAPTSMLPATNIKPLAMNMAPSIATKPNTIAMFI